MPGFSLVARQATTCRQIRSHSYLLFAFHVFVVLALAGESPRACADPVIAEVFPVVQPDGTRVEVRVWGDEFYRVVESLDGYSLVRDPESGATCYARLSPDGSELISTGVQVGLGLPLDLEPHIRINPVSARAKVAVARARLATERVEALATLGRSVQPLPPNTGEVQGIVLLVDFPDQPSTITPSEISNYCNAEGYTGYGNNGSVRDYFYDVSDGNLLYTNFVPIVYYRAQQPKSYYDDPNVPCCSRARSLVLDALSDLDSHGFDFSQYDSNGDGLVDAVNCFYAGTRNGPWTYGLWPHSGWLSFSADGVSTGRYQITDIGSQLRLRTFCHENGHMVCYWPDLYDYGYESTGVGNFCLMCYGASNTNPAEPSAYMKYIAGWSTTTILTNPLVGLPVPSGVNTLYKFEHPTLANEYYLIENRQQSGRDAAIPAAGLAIWHIDTHGSNNNEQMTPESHYEVTLVQADGDWDLENNRNYGDSSDLWAAPTYPECTPFTEPNTSWWYGNPSALFVMEISPSAPSMTFAFREHWDCNDNGIPDEQDILDNTSDDENGNGVPDECECPVECSTPQAEPVPSNKNRYLSIVPGNPGQQTGIRITFAYMPPPFSAWDGEKHFVGQPHQVCENSGQSPVEATPPNCGSAAGLPQDWFWAAPIECDVQDAVFMDWSTLSRYCVDGGNNGGACVDNNDCPGGLCGSDGVVHLYHEAIVPSRLQTAIGPIEIPALYDIQAIDSSCSLRGETNYSYALSVTQAGWGDVCGPGVTGACSGPADGVVDVQNDVLGVLGKFDNTVPLQKSRADLEPGDNGLNNGPDFMVSVANDVLFALAAFTGAPYPFELGDPCNPD